ncbi:exopolysaccharide biosynthesis protein [Billgrantia endophytica]|uniref:Exopolysaccharide biosynthesis protein n=1 Tax=Billgrantia endophytica TaxID=2033802 RepID=A0A2N7TZK7_9GAMM|nr:exopolysaccharide biosynthesis protein [Halomonas endophytica]PMR73615.1 exopolysaccharide biosynthesis protein [Halomonas endophytica]
MEESSEPHNLEEMIQAIEDIETPSSRIRFDEVLEVIGRRSFGPLLLLAGLITLMPVISGIPGVPVIMALLTFLVSIQLLLGRKTFWLPAWVRNRTLPSGKVHKGLSWMRTPARWVDRLLRHRFGFMTGRRGMQVTAVACVLITLSMPPMEFVPFSANIAGAALTLFGLAIMARDGLLTMLALLLTAVTLWVVFSNLL